MQRRTREWWRRTVERWRRSGLAAAEFAAREQLTANTLRWWSSEFGRGTRAKHGSSPSVPIEIAVARAGEVGAARVLEIAVGGAVLRCEIGADVDYVASLVRALRGES